jgi:hypothetical protein
MALSREQEAVLDELDVNTIRQRLLNAGANPHAVVPGLCGGMVSRIDVEQYAAKREKKEARRAARRPYIILVIGIAASALIAVASAFVSYHFLRSPASTQEKAGGASTSQPSAPNPQP